MPHGWKSFPKQVFSAFAADEAPTRAAAVAFYAALSISPLVLLFVAITGFLGESTQERMFESVTSTVGAEAGEAIRTLAAQGDAPGGAASLSLVVSLVVILFSASGVVAALQRGLNRVWNVQPAPGEGVKGWVRKRAVSMSLVLGVLFLLLVSLVATTVVGMIVPSSGWAWNLVTLAVSFAVFVLLFAAMFKMLPDVRIGWGVVWRGAVVTALLFAIGKYGLGLYLASASYESSYGAAGSLVALLVWAYYSSMIVFLGAEITQVYARRAGARIEPDKHAVRTPTAEQTPA
jgi:membrane protein